MPAYFLPDHVYLCRRAEAVVFLDLRNDDYIMVNGATAKCLLSQSIAHDASVGCLNKELHGLVHAGLLTTDSKFGRPIRPTTSDIALEELVGSEDIAIAHVTASHIWHFTFACIVAALRRRFSRIEHVVRAVERRRLAARVPLDLPRARALTSVFHKLRFFFPANYLCLYDSLALLEFLARYGVYPRWIFGVQLEPWSAHCWVQDAGFTFNESAEEASRYTPIMVV
jgi:hypothetical protein